MTTIYTNNAYGQPLTQTDPAGNTTYYLYDQYGDPPSQTDSLGDTTEFNYYFDPDNPNDPYERRPDVDHRSAREHTRAFGTIMRATCSRRLRTPGTPNATTTDNTYDQYGDLLTTTTPQERDHDEYL